MQLPNIQSIHNLHIWTLDDTYNVLTLHAVVPPRLEVQETEAIKKRLLQAAADIDIHHVTVELETAEEQCSHQGRL